MLPHDEVVDELLEMMEEAEGEDSRKEVGAVRVKRGMLKGEGDGLSLRR